MSDKSLGVVEQLKSWIFHFLLFWQFLDAVMINLIQGRSCLALPRKRCLEEIVKNPLMVRNICIGLLYVKSQNIGACDIYSINIFLTVILLKKLYFKPLKLCLATRSTTSVAENYSNLFNWRPNICKYWCLNNPFIPNNWFYQLVEQLTNDYSRDQQAVG